MSTATAFYGVDPYNYVNNLTAEINGGSYNSDYHYYNVLLILIDKIINIAELTSFYIFKVSLQQKLRNLKSLLMLNEATKKRTKLKEFVNKPQTFEGLNQIT